VNIEIRRHHLNYLHSSCFQP